MSSKNIIKKFWSFFSRLRGAGIDYQVFLIVMILYKKDLLDRIINSRPNSFIGSIYKSLDEVSGLEREVLINDIMSFESDLEKINLNDIYDFYGIMRESKEDFYRIFDELLFKLEEIMSKSSGGYIQPGEIT